MLALTAPAASAEVRGLVVGVSDYEFLNADLRGPANDVGLVSNMLLARGAMAENITVLAAPGVRLDPRLSHNGAPTRAAIIAALQGLAATAQPGDTVLFYFSGHGSQMPDASGDEAGGYDEILLPSDARNWKGAIGAVENALVDDELGVMMQAILDTGAELVAILDACHSATGFRALPDAQISAARYIDPARLGVPNAVPGDSLPGQIAPPLSGRFVFLYSSQSDQRSFEYPVGDPGDAASWYGDFTRSLMPVLTSANGISWSQALLATVDGMAKDGPAAQTPDAEGPMLGVALFGAADPVAPVWRTKGGALNAGLLHGIEPGAQVAVYASAETTGDPVIAEVAEAKADSARLARTPGLPAEGYARLHRPALPAALKLGAPVLMQGATPGQMPDLLRDLTASLDGVEVIAQGAPDYVPVFTGDSLALAGRDGVLDGLGAGSSPRLSASASREEAAAFLDRAIRAHRLRQALKAAEGSGVKGFALPGSSLSVTLAKVDVPGTDSDCGDPGAETAAEGEVRADACDQLWLTVKNGSKTARDITVLYIDRDFRVIPIYPDGALSNRLGFGESEEIGLQISNPSNRPGQEDLVVLAAPAVQGAPRTVLTALADGTARAMPEDTPDLGQWLFAAADPEVKSRNFSFGGALPSLEVTRFRITLVPTSTR
ncbi:caspase family protein [Pseudooceanicola sp.]|uniref:caspase family protein n=1 Tax=Pseudooceanicola sp. TaxID=1914328 RepID=UPI00260FAEB3|nr:caspase family protein [Pseudooceanicola sp.]